MQMRDAVRDDVQNLHLDMIRQFHLQQAETRSILEVSPSPLVARTNTHSHTRTLCLCVCVCVCIMYLCIYVYLHITYTRTLHPEQERVKRSGDLRLPTCGNAPPKRWALKKNRPSGSRTRT